MVEDRVKEIPLVDAAAIDNLALLNSPHSNYARIVERLSPDIAAHFLKLANRAHHGRIVRTIEAAVVLLGYQNMRQILVTSLLLDHFTKRLGTRNFSFDIFKKQARFCGVTSRILADMLNHKYPEDLYTVSILSNIGKLIIAVYFSKDQREIAALQIDQGIAASAAERMVLGISHAEVSAMALKRFNLPEDICDAVRYHNIVERQIPLGCSFQLEIIARKSAGIVHQFVLPDEDQINKLAGQLRGIVDDGKYLYRSMVEDGLRPEKDQRTYSTLVEQTSQLLIDRLEELWPQPGQAGIEN
ncbi:hypothetical protein JY97_15185 [Alkalispirochaeta odontotermitis]|nr:hypothetical protein JY97_15185 [Alkalispirochaeta odontotermitis]